MKFLSLFNKQLRHLFNQQNYQGYYCKFNQRSILSLEGKDAHSLLQGIQTNDMNIFQKKEDQVAIHTAFLNLKGRIITDALIIRPKIHQKNGTVNKQDEYWIDIDSSQKQDLVNHIKKYTFRKKVIISDLSDQLNNFAIYTPIRQISKEILGREMNDLFSFNQELQYGSQSDEDDSIYADLNYVDPRNGQIGIRFITGQVESSIDYGDFYKKVSEKNYNQFRMISGITEGQEISDKLPFTANLDFYNSISMNKGCYIGQELTSRSYRMGVIRKRILPFYVQTDNVQKKTQSQQNEIQFDFNLDLIDNEFNNDLQDQQILNMDGKQIGSIISNIGNIGLATVNYMTQNFDDTLKLSDGRIVKLLINSWLDQSIKDYKDYILQNLEKNSAYDA